MLHLFSDQPFHYLQWNFCVVSGTVIVMASSPSHCDASSDSDMMNLKSDTTDSKSDGSGSDSDSDSSSSGEFGCIDEGSTYSQTSQVDMTARVQHKAGCVVTLMHNVIILYNYFFFFTFHFSFSVSDRWINWICQRGLLPSVNCSNGLHSTQPVYYVILLTVSNTGRILQRLHA